MKSAEILSVGTELLLGQIVDTHAPAMARLLAEHGIACRRRTTIGDNLERLTEGLREALARAEVVVTIGGLGPTEDDLTRDAIAAALEERLVAEPEVEAKLREFFASRRLPWVESNARQALRPESAALVPNPNGTAPGLHVSKGANTVLALPGPKGEFDPMANGPVREILRGLGGGGVIHSRTLRIAGLGESYVEKRLGELNRSENPTVAPYAHVGEVHIRLTASAPDVAAAESLIEPLDAAVRERLGDAVFGTDGTTLEESVHRDLALRGETLAVAESMTGGGLSARMTNAPGSSQTFLGGVVVYSVAAKAALLDLPTRTLAEEGPVSEWTALALARAVRAKLGATHGVAIVGNAGPEPDVDGKPVGLVHVAYAGPEVEDCETSTFRGTRDDVRRRAEQTALVLLRRTVRR